MAASSESCGGPILSLSGRRSSISTDYACSANDSEGTNPRSSRATTGCCLARRGLDGIQSRAELGDATIPGECLTDSSILRCQQRLTDVREIERLGPSSKRSYQDGELPKDISKPLWVVVLCHGYRHLNRIHQSFRE